MRQTAFVLILSLLTFHLFSQQKPLFAEGTYPHIYLTHQVEPKQNFYSVGRLYNVAPAEIASFNQLPIEKGLTLGKPIKIPLSETNFTHTKKADTAEALIRTYYIIRGRETIDQVASHFHLTTDELKKNNPAVKAVTNGTKLLVGYLKVSKQLSPLAGGGLVITAVPVQNAIQPVHNNVVSEMDTSAITFPPVKITTVTNNTVPHSFNGGVFKTIYSSQTTGTSEVSENGAASSFKSTSGWKDGKYYCFYNNAPQGTIVMITNPSNGKSVYAKVLDALPDMRQQNTVIIQVSNAAADELGAADAKFTCSVTVRK